MVFCFCSITTSGLRCCKAEESPLAESDLLIGNLIVQARCTFGKMCQIKFLVSGTESWTYRISVIIIQCIFFRFELIPPEIRVTYQWSEAVSWLACRVTRREHQMEHYIPSDNCSHSYVTLLFLVNGKFHSLNSHLSPLSLSSFFPVRCHYFKKEKVTWRWYCKVATNLDNVILISVFFIYFFREKLIKYTIHIASKSNTCWYLAKRSSPNFI